MLVLRTGTGQRNYVGSRIELTKPDRAAGPAQAHLLGTASPWSPAQRQRGRPPENQAHRHTRVAHGSVPANTLPVQKAPA